MSGYSKKKFVIKTFKQPQQVDEAQAQRVWASLKAAIHQIHSQDASSLSFEELYRCAAMLRRTRAAAAPRAYHDCVYPPALA